MGSIGKVLSTNGISRRSFIKFCASITSALSLPPASMQLFAEQLSQAKRPSVIWLSFQECTGCTESLTRSHAPAIEDLIFNTISLDYHHTLMAASGTAAEQAREEVIRQQHGRYLLVVDGSIPLAMDGACSTIAGRTNLDILQESVEGAAAVIAIGTCATYGGLPAAGPNPTAAAGVAELMQRRLLAQRKLVNISGCPPLPIAISSVLAHYLAYGRFPKLDALQRPLAFYGNTIHERCSRYHYYQQEKFAESFDDDGARMGWCLYKLGCKGPTTHNACATYKWNGATSFPVDAGHGCIGCSEPGFWDHGPLYSSLDDLLLSARHSDEQLQNQQLSVDEGAELYNTNCAYCHSADPKQLKTPLEGITDVVRSGKVRAHRRLDFSQRQLDALEKYFKSLRR